MIHRNKNMGEESKVILHGMWASTYGKRVELALKIKGIQFEYVEEDMRNKSQTVLSYNPVYKKIPILVHNGKPISESLIIIEYIDETWKNKSPILPEDPYERANVRFWAGYIQLVLETTRKLFNSDDAPEKYLEEVHQKQKILEEGIKEIYPGRNVDELSSENLGLLDIMVVATFGAYKAQEEVLGLKILDPEKTPLLFSWVEALMELHPSS